MPFSSVIAQGAAESVFNKDFAIPAQFGSLLNVNHAGDRSIVYIQDAHGQLDAQRNIRKLLSFLQEKYGFDTLFLEGAPKGPISSDLLRLFNNEEINRNIAEYLLEQGAVGGPDIFLLESGKKIKAHGTEANELYLENLKLFRKVIGQKELSDRFLSELKSQILSLVSHYFNQDLKNFFKEWLLLTETEGDFLKRLDVLKKFSDKWTGRDLSDPKNQFDYPQLVRFFALKLKEALATVSDVSAIQNAELENLKEWIRVQEIQADLEPIFQVFPSLSYVNGALDPRSLLEQFYEEAAPKGFDFSNYPYLSNYFGQLILSGELDSAQIHSELTTITHQILAKLARSDEEQGLIRLYKDFVLLKKLLTLELTPDDFQFVTERADELALPVIRKRIAALAGDKLKIHLDSILELSAVVKDALSFYDVSARRESFIFESVMDVMRQQGKKKAVLVAGGFHTKGLESLMEAYNVSFVRIAPKINHLNTNDQYLKRMMLDSSLTDHVMNASPGRLSIGVSNAEVGQYMALVLAQAIKHEIPDLGSVTPSRAGMTAQRVKWEALREAMRIAPVYRGNEELDPSRNELRRNPADTKIAVIGTGFVGMTKAVLLSNDFGYDVIGVDINESVVNKLQKGRLPQMIPGLRPLLRDNLNKKLLHFTTSYEEALSGRDLIFLALPTPQSETGHADMSKMENAVQKIADLVKDGDEKILIVKSTIPPENYEKLQRVADERLRRRRLSNRVKIHLVSEPEFLREGQEIIDDRDEAGQGKAKRVVIGANDPAVRERVAALYKNPIVSERNRVPVVLTDLISGHYVKYASNGYRGMKISWINFIGWLAEASGYDIDELADEIGEDPRIIRDFLSCGIGFGGSCFPKDIAANVQMLREAGVPYDLALDVLAVNDVQWRHFLDEVIVRQLYGVNGKTVAVLGGAFKPGTSDIREARAVRIIEELLAKGAKVKVFDPEAVSNLRKHFKKRKNVVFHNNPRVLYDMLSNVDAVVLATEWDIFKNIDFRKLKNIYEKQGRMLPFIFDGRNVLDGSKISKMGFQFFNIGHGAEGLSPDIEQSKFEELLRRFFLAMRLAYVNLLAEVADKRGANIRQILEGFGLDPVVGAGYLSPGLGFGGYYLPNSLDRFEDLIKSRLHGYYLDAYRRIRHEYAAKFGITQDQDYVENPDQIPFISAIRKIAGRQIDLHIDRAKHALGGTLQGKHVTVMGLSYKAGTPSIENSASLELIKRLIEEGAIVHATDADSETIHNAIQQMPANDQLIYHFSVHEALENSELQVLATESRQYRDAQKLFFDQNGKPISAALRILDARSFYHPEEMAKLGFDYYAIGVPDLRSAARAELRDSWVAQNVPQLNDYTVVSRQMEAALPLHIVESVRERRGERLSDYVEQLTITGGLGALMPDLFDGWAANGIKGIGIMPLPEHIKGESFSVGLPQGTNLGSILRSVLEKTDIHFVIRVAGVEGYHGLSPNLDIGVDVYQSHSDVHGMPLYYLDAYFTSAKGDRISIFNEVYPDSSAWRDVHMAVFGQASEQLVMELQKRSLVESKILFVDNEVYVSLPTPLMPDALHFEINHTPVDAARYEPNLLSYELLRLPEGLRPFVARDDRISLIDYVGIAYPAIAGVALVEHTAVLRNKIFRAYAPKVVSYNKNGMKNTNGVLFDTWQIPEFRRLIEQITTQAELNTDNDRDFFDRLEQQPDVKLRFQRAAELIKAKYVLDLLIWLDEKHGYSFWYEDALRQIQKFRSDIQTLKEVAALIDEEIHLALEGNTSWEDSAARFEAVSNDLLQIPIVSNVRRQVPYKGPDKWLEILEHLKKNPKDLGQFRKQVGRVILGGRIFSGKDQERFQRIKQLIKELNLEEQILPIPVYNRSTARRIFRAMSGTVMIADEFMEAAATSQSKGISNMSELIGTWGGSNPEYFLIHRKADNRVIDIFSEKLTHDQLDAALKSGELEILNGRLVRYAPTEKSAEQDGGRRPSAMSLMEALRGLYSDFQTPELRRQRQFNVLKSSVNVDIVRGQSRAHAHLFGQLIQLEELRKQNPPLNDMSRALYEPAQVSGLNHPAAHLVKMIQDYIKNGQTDELNRYLTEIAVLGPDEVRIAFGAQQGDYRGLAAVMALISALKPDLLPAMKKWNHQVHRLLDAAYNMDGIHEVVNSGQIHLHQTSSPDTIVISRSLGERNVFFAVHLSTAGPTGEGKFWTQVKDLNAVGLPRPGQTYQVVDHLLDYTYQMVHDDNMFSQYGWNIGIPVIPHEADRHGIAQPGFRFQILEILPLPSVKRAELRQPVVVADTLDLPVRVETQAFIANRLSNHVLRPDLKRYLGHWVGYDSPDLLPLESTLIHLVVPQETERNGSVEFLKTHLDQVRSSHPDQAEKMEAALRLFLADDHLFSVNYAFVPKEIKPADVKALSRMLKPVVEAHSAKMLVLLFEGLCDEECQEMSRLGATADFDRVYVFDGISDYYGTVNALLSGNFSSLTDRHLSLAKRLNSTMNTLYEKAGGEGVFGLQARLDHSQVIGDLSEFHHILGQVTRKFQRLSEPSFSLLDRLAAELSFSLVTSGQPDAVSIRQLVVDLLNIYEQNRSIQLEFNPGRLDGIFSSIEALRAMAEVLAQAA